MYLGKDFNKAIVYEHSYLNAYKTFEININNTIIFGIFLIDLYHIYVMLFWPSILYSRVCGGDIHFFFNPTVPGNYTIAITCLPIILNIEITYHNGQKRQQKDRRA